MIECKNCANQFEGNYCNQCGQPATTHRLNFHFLWHDLQHGLFHMDKGVLYSLKELFIHPGHTIKEYIDGKRVGHFKPFSLLVVLATVYGLLKHLVLAKAEFTASNLVINDVTIKSLDIQAINEWISHHDAIMSLIVIPFYAVGSYVAYRKQGLNFVEHLVVNAYLSSLRIAISLVSLPFLFLMQNRTGHDFIDTLTSVLSVAITIWTFLQLFDTLHWWQNFKKLALTYLIFLAQMITVGALIIFVILGFYFKIY